MITASSYFLPEIEVLSGFETFPSGKTNPMLITGVCKQTGIKSDYVVKYIGANEMGGEASVRELLGAFIGMELELNIASPAIINISSLFSDSLKGKQEYAIASKSIGNNFGSTYLIGNMPMVNNQKLSNSQINDAIDIFAFDIFIGNSDRRIGKPNLCTIGDKIHIFDHDLAFGLTNLGLFQHKI